ncbi:ferredoxin [Mycobacterium sp. EPa45]|uniref:ferredoxin n=1 Tax=Mycobacterium sp. EPa45 TaxID=1545728 RepID=UPI0006421BE9|nr:ferredoxin [Mycobacterium sp. EPa45]AKK30122.1 ferredoxin [Mycobacterium sp. EPa45]
MRIVVDRTKCSGHARCFAMGPQIYELDDEGYNALTEKVVPPGQEQDAIDGAASCPEGAITIE